MIYYIIVIILSGYVFLVDGKFSFQTSQATSTLHEKGLNDSKMTAVIHTPLCN